MPDTLAYALVAGLTTQGVSAGARLLVALSGGPDSAALLHLLHVVAKAHRWQVLAAHFDHGLGDAASRGAACSAAQGLAAQCRVPLHLGAVAAGSILAAAGRAEGVEELARRHRYDFLHRTAAATAADWIAVAHHADDNLETILMRLLQGSPGPYAMPARRGRVVRPLLDVPQASLTAYVSAQELIHVIDPSNAERRFLRNRVRERAPGLLASVPGSSVGLAAAARHSEDAWHEVGRQARSQLPWSVVRSLGRGLPALRTSASGFLLASNSVRSTALYRAVDALASGARESGRGLGQQRRVPRRFLAPLLAVSGRSLPVAGPLLGVAGHGVSITLGARWLTVESDPLRFQGRGANVVPGPKSGYLLAVGEPPQEGNSSEHRLRGTRLNARLCAERFVSGAASPEPPGQVRLSAGDFPIVVRSVRPGDVIRQGERRTSLSRLLAEWGVPRAARAEIPLVANVTGVVAVAGSVYGFRDLTAVTGGNVSLQFVDNM
jgi:tRNA(Ile)-lysidine synthetase-like protein